MAEILHIGSPMEYVLFRQMKEEGLPEGAGKHMLRLKGKPERRGSDQVVEGLCQCLSIDLA